MQFEVLRSTIDPSVNFVHHRGDGQALEARYVRRHPDYIACYLSSQTACEKACRFCHLTFTGQNQAEDATPWEIKEQARQVLDYYQETAPGAKVVHFNFMARGEPLASRYIREWSQVLLPDLGELAQEYGLLPRFLVSTILPEDLERSLPELFPITHPEIYYSLYSLREGFRRRWLPRAMDPEKALVLLTEWQRFAKKIVRIHYALIQGENDSQEDAKQVVAALRRHGLRADFTLVRYNPPSPRHGSESPAYEAYAQFLRENLEGVRVKTIERVGQDVAASCGMFLNVRGNG